MDEGRWITMNGTHVFIKEGQNPMDAFIRRQKGPANYENGKLEEEYTKWVVKDGKTVDQKVPTKYVLENGEEINFLDKKEYKKATDDFLNKLTDEEKEVLAEYINDTGWFYAENNELFKNHDLDKNKRVLNELFENKAYKLKQDTLVFRRGSEDVEIIEKGFTKEKVVSTSAYDKLPKTMPSGKPFGDKEYYILLKKGTKVLPIEKVATELVAYDKGEKQTFTRQHELLLAPNTTFEMVKDMSEIKRGYYGAYKDNKYKYVLKVKGVN